METRILSPDEWPLVEPVMHGVFKGVMPADPRQATFLAALDGAKLAGFMKVEVLFRVFNLYVAPGLP